MSEKFLKRLRDRGIIALIALLFSLGLWFRVVGGEKIEATKVVKLDFKLPKDLTLFTPYMNEVSVKVRGPAPFVREFQKNDLTVALDVSNYGTGEHEIGFRADQFKIPLGIDLTLINPPSIKIFLDREITKRIAVRPVLSTQLPEDYKVESMAVQPSSVEIKGSRIRLGLLTSLPTEVIYVTENSLVQHFEVALNFTDFWGIEPVEKVSTVHVEVNLKGPSKRMIFKNVPILLRAGPPSHAKTIDFKSKSIKLRPQFVDLTLEGPQVKLDALDAASLEVWVQLPDLKRGVYRPRINWKLAPDIRILDRSVDSVSVSVP